MRNWVSRGQLTVKVEREKGVDKPGQQRSWQNGWKEKRTLTNWVSRGQLAVRAEREKDFD